MSEDRAPLSGRILELIGIGLADATDLEDVDHIERTPMQHLSEQEADILVEQQPYGRRYARLLERWMLSVCSASSRSISALWS